MKILIQDYTSILSTEPIYLNECFKRIGITSNLWDTSKFSVFDMLDLTTPDILITHYASAALQDIFKYLSNNKKTSLLLNITGAQKGHLDILTNLMDINNVECPFLFSNLHEKIYTVKSKKKILNLLPGVDLFLLKQNVPIFNLNAAVLSNNKDLAQKASQGISTYHKIGVGVQDEYFDFTVNASNMKSLYDKYEKIVLASDLSVSFSQLFFDAVYNSKKVVLKTNDEKKSGEILGDLFDGNEEDEDIATAIKNQIKTKHTCFNRASRMMHFLKNDNASKQLLKIGENL